MKHLSWQYRGRRNAQQQREFRAAQRKRIAARWAKRAQDEMRVDRRVEIVIRDSLRPMTTLTLTQRDFGERLSKRWSGIGKRRLTTRSLDRLIARFLE
jgi:hypothetical protein